MTHDVDELEQRAKSMTDWRQQVNERPMAALGVAAAGGMLIGLLASRGSDKDRQQHSYHYQPQTHDGGASGVSGWVTGERGPTQATQAGKDRAASKIDEIRGALMGLAAAKAEEFLKEALPGFSHEVDRLQQQSETRHRERSDQTSDCPAAVTTT
jgi:hypothetical protein